MGRKRRESNEHRKPLNLWTAPPHAGPPVACLATTFEFDAEFFEADCLGRFLSMENDPTDSDAVGYLIEREEKLAETAICVMVDRSRATSKESLRWDVLPIMVRSGIQHSKVSLLVWSNVVRVVIGSGNLTEAGYRKNLEVFGCLEVSKEAGGAAEFVSQTINFLEALLERGVGSGDRAGPKRRAIEIIATVRKLIRDWPEAAPTKNLSVAPVFVGLGKPLIEQLRELWPSPLKPRRVDVLSPFFDDDPQSAPLIPQTLSLLSQRGEAGISFHVAGDESQDGRIRMKAPATLLKAVPAKWEIELSRVLPIQDGEEDVRPLHAKMLELSSDDCGLRLIGSSNFTTAGFRAGTSPGNLEANLVYIIRGEEEARTLFGVWPTEDELDPVDEAIIWDPIKNDADDEGSGSRLPMCFREALFFPEATPHLLLVLGKTLPADWSVLVADGSVLVSAATVANFLRPNAVDGDATEVEIVVPWPSPPPFVLTVRCMTEAGALTADWPVNVSNPDQLAPPDELRALSLSELILVLGSTRPIHEAVRQIVKLRVKGETGDDAALDPHQRVRTETFLLQRLKRVSLALEGLKQRLERPAAHAAAFRWRLFGPIGPRALLHALQREASREGELDFFVAELALALKRVDLRKACLGGLPVEQAEPLLKQCIREVADAVSLGSRTSPSEHRPRPCAEGLTAFAHVEAATSLGLAQRPLNPRDKLGGDLSAMQSMTERQPLQDYVAAALQEALR